MLSGQRLIFGHDDSPNEDEGFRPGMIFGHDASPNEDSGFRPGVIFRHEDSPNEDNGFRPGVIFGHQDDEEEPYRPGAIFGHQDMDEDCGCGGGCKEGGCGCGGGCSGGCGSGEKGKRGASLPNRTAYRRRAEDSAFNDQQNHVPLVLTGATSSNEDRLTPPMTGTPGSNCGTFGCRDEMWGDASNCASHASVNAQVMTADVLQDYVTSGWTVAARSVTATDSEIELLAAAFGALRANGDLVRWAMCMTWLGIDEFASTVLLAWIWDAPVGLWTEINHPVVIAMADNYANPGGGAFVMPFTNVIWINRSNVAWGPAVSLWNSGETSLRACATIQVAGLLLHELMHVANLSIADLDKTQCNPTYLVQNAFQWACFQRFTNAGKSACCTVPASDDVFGCSTTPYTAAGDCQQASETPETWWEQTEDWAEQALEDFSDWWEGLTDAGTRGVTSVGFDFAICQICPEVCCGGGPCPHGPEDGAWDTCLPKIAKHNMEKYDLDVLDTI